MKNREKKLLFLAAGLLLLTATMSHGKVIRQYEKDVQVRYFEGTTISTQMIDQMESMEKKQASAEAPSVTAWNAERQIVVKNPDLPFEDRALCIIIKGDKEQVIKIPLLEGGFGYRDDEEACVISKGTAWKLFGSPHVIGKKVTCKGKQWVIRGVVDREESFILLTAERMNPIGFENLSFSYQEREQMKGRTEELMMRYSMNGDGVLIDGSFFGAVVRLAFTVPLWVLFLMILDILVSVERVRTLPGSRLLMIAFLLVGSGVLIRYGFRFPQEFIPTKWSDFSFWTQQYQSIKDTANQIAQLPKTFYDAKLVRDFYSCLGTSVGSSCFFMIYYIFD